VVNPHQHQLNERNDNIYIFFYNNLFHLLNPLSLYLVIGLW